MQIGIVFFSFFSSRQSWGFLICMAWAQFTMASRTALRLHITALPSYGHCIFTTNEITTTTYDGGRLKGAMLYYVEYLR
jgi:hypothetical protein